MISGRSRSIARCSSRCDVSARELPESRSRNEISIRAIADADLVSVSEILNAEIASSPYIYAETPVSLDERRAWLALHAAANLPVFVATESHDDAKVIGWASLSVYRPSSGYRFTTEASVYVAPFAQRRGIGRQLLARLCDEARARDNHAIVASIDAENAPSVALFEREGFREVGRLEEVGRKFDAWRTQLLFLRSLG
jgi:L-amino acid N-acyltransferase YncA